MTDDNEEVARAERPNKTQLKREIAERSDLIDRMTHLSDSELKRLGLDDETIDAVGAVRALPASGARNRQLKYCTKQLATTDMSAVKTYLDDRHSQQLAVNQKFHHLEQWRERLIEEGDGALGAALSVWPQIDRQQMRQLIRDAQRERSSGKPAGAAKKLFRHLRELGDPDE